MKPSLKRTLLASTIVGLAITAASGASAQYGGRNERSNVVTYSRDTGGYCDFAGCPDRFWKYPVHYGPVFFHGQWYQGPVYFRADRRGRQYWVRGGWHRDEWRGRRPYWARQSHDGPPLGLAYYASQGFRISDRWHQPGYGDSGGERVSYNAFHRTLAAHGDWVYSDRWGQVWVPSDVPREFHPYYTGGHWANTREYGWTWVSDYDWGDVAFHYGRWVNDPDDGWMWIPGYVWSPGWVVWRSNDRYTGWMPMPPDEGFLRGDSGSFSISINFNRTDDYYGYSRWYGRGYDENRFASNWVFVGTGNLAERDYRSHAVSGGNVVNIINTTTNVTNYTVVNNYVVNRSVDVRAVEQAGGRPVVAVSAATVIKSPALITTADTGRAVQTQMRQAQPQGTGTVSSAPQPSAAVVRDLSTRPVERNGRRPAHLFTQTTVVNAPLKPAPAGTAAPAANAPTAPVNAATPAPAGEKPGGNAERGGPAGKPSGAMTAPAPPAAATPAENNPAGERGGKNRDRVKGGSENPATPQGAAPVPPAQSTAPAANTPATPPNEKGGRNRDRNKGGAETQGGAQGTAPTAPTQAAPATPAENNPPTERRGRNRDRNGGGVQTEGGPQGAAPTAPPQAAPATPAENNPPTERRGRNRDRNRGGGETEGGPQGAAPMAPAQTAPAAAPSPAANPPADTGGRNRERHRGGPNTPAAAPAETATPPTQPVPVVTPPAANTPADKAKDRRKHKGNKDDTQTEDTNPPQ